MRRVSEQKVSGGFAPIFASIYSRFYKENVLIGDVARYLFYFYCLLLQKCRRFFVYFCCRTPQGVRGLKLVWWSKPQARRLSHPARGAWIEILRLRNTPTKSTSHPARGAWIEMDGTTSTVTLSSPSHPARGAWIEIARHRSGRGRRRSHPARGAWIEINFRSPQTAPPWSHPARGAWIEIIPRSMC